MSKAIPMPWLPPGRTVVLPGRGETFVRWHQHADPAAPTVLLLHGWTASADLQFFTAYEALAERYSFVGIDHRGHGRGIRSTEPFHLEDAADDAAAVLRELGIGPVVTVGYSMGGPISLHLARRHPELVRGMVVQATALEWRATRAERLRWKAVRLLGPILRSAWYPNGLRFGLGRLLGPGHPLRELMPWLEAESRRNDSHAIVHAGFALSRYDARPWAHLVAKPAGSLITTADRLVPPVKQRELATALGAHVMELAEDHLAALVLPVEFSAATVALVDQVVGRLHADG
ncbi:MAG: alpha/beta fold hydrolase [Actinomycetota bacterium]